MRNIGVISDIHANIDALDAVFSDMKEKNIDMVLCTGDIVGYHTFPDEVVKRIQKENVICIRGNHDNDVVNKQFNITRSPDIFRVTYDLLSDESLEWLATLPVTREITVEECTILMTHGSPSDLEEYLFEGSEEATAYASECTNDILLSGHTHLPWVKEIEGTLFVNSGSVGKPKIGKPVATWAHIAVDGSSCSAEVIEVEYDCEKVAAAAENAGFDRYANTLRQGHV